MRRFGAVHQPILPRHIAARVPGIRREKGSGSWARARQEAPGVLFPGLWKVSGWRRRPDPLAGLLPPRRSQSSQCRFHAAPTDDTTNGIVKLKKIFAPTRRENGRSRTTSNRFTAVNRQPTASAVTAFLQKTLRLKTYRMAPELSPVASRCCLAVNCCLIPIPRSGRSGTVTRAGASRIGTVFPYAGVVRRRGCLPAGNQSVADDRRT